MAGVFDTSEMGGPQESPISIQKPIEKSPNAFALKVTELAVEAGKEAYVRHKLGEQEEALSSIEEQRNEELGLMRLKALEEKFDVLSTGMQQGLPTSQANVRARAALAETKASVPWIADRADEAFRSFFGGSAGFEASTEEKVALQVQEQIMQVAATMNISGRDAQIIVQREAQNRAREQVLLERTQTQQLNTGAFRDYNNDNMMTAAIKVQGMVKGLVTPGMNTLKPEALASVNAGISHSAMEMRMKLQSKAFNRDGKPLLTEEDFKLQMATIDKWEKDQKAMVADRSYLTLMNAIRDTGNAELAVAANDLFPVFKMANEAGGQAMVEAYIKGLLDPKYVPTLTARNPKLREFFNDDFTPRQMTAAGLAFASGHGKILDPSIPWAQNAMNRGGAESTQAFLADPGNAAVAETTYLQVDAADPAVADTATTFHRQASSIAPTETSRTLVGKVFRNFAQKHPDEGFKILAHSLDGMAQSVRSAFFNAGQGLPSYISVTPSVDATTEDITSPIAKRFKVTTQDGSTLPPEAKEAMAAQFRVLSNNPEYVAEIERELGIPLTPIEILEIMVNGQLHPKFLAKGQKQLQEGKFKPATKRNAVPTTLGSLFSLMTPSEDIDPELGKLREMFSPKLEARVTNQLPKLTQEQVDDIKSQPTLEAKKAKAIEYGVPEELVLQSTRGL